jgi:hypothetical protein
VQHWYSILDKELKTLVRNEALRLDEPPTLRFVFETSERIDIYDVLQVWQARAPTEGVQRG